MLDTTSPTKLKPFQFASMTPPEQAFFMNKCASMAQMSAAEPAQKAVVNAGTAPSVSCAADRQRAVLFRDRVENRSGDQRDACKTVLGDIVDATPAYIRVPLFHYTDTATSAPAASRKRTKTARGALRRANDGFLHSSTTR